MRTESFIQLSLIISELSIFIWTWGPMDPRCAKCVDSEGVRQKVNFYSYFMTNSFFCKFKIILVRRKIVLVLRY